VLRAVHALAAVFLILPCVYAGAQTPASSSELQANISRLSALDYPVRMNAARTIRRLPATEAVPALAAAVMKHPDEFVRYRAFILLSSFNDKGTAALVRGLLTDSNDRLREAA
jgi:HEAT repeat protein